MAKNTELTATELGKCFVATIVVIFVWVAVWFGLQAVGVEGTTAFLAGLATIVVAGLAYLGYLIATGK